MNPRLNTNIGYPIPENQTPHIAKAFAYTGGVIGLLAGACDKEASILTVLVDGAMLAGIGHVAGMGVYHTAMAARDVIKVVTGNIKSLITNQHNETIEPNDGPSLPSRRDRRHSI